MSPDRGQTPHDFALGIGVFLLTVAFVFSTLPGLAEPFETDVTAVEEAHADRAAATLVDHLSSGAGPGALDPDVATTFFRQNETGDSLRGFLGLGTESPVNVTVTNGSRPVELTDGEGEAATLTAGDALADRPVATTVRLVSFTGERHCEPTCRLVVEVG